MQGFTLTDLDANPEHRQAALELFQGCPPGHNHAVCGEPSRMGCKVIDSDLDEALGTLVIVRADRVLGALAICPYSDEQVTLWGPVIHRAFVRMDIGTHLLSEARKAIRDGGYDSIRINVDTRNRAARNFLLSKGLTPWKDNYIYERDLLSNLPENSGCVALAKPADHADVATILSAAFPDSNHCDEPLVERERAGYRHHLVQDAGHIVAAAAVKVTQGRSWISLVAVDEARRGQGFGTKLLTGLLHNEASHGATRIGLEVLEDNQAARRSYERAGFNRAWKATIMTGPA